MAASRPKPQQRLSYVVSELPDLTGLSLASCYRLARQIGRRLKRRIIVPAAALDRWLSEGQPPAAE